MGQKITDRKPQLPYISCSHGEECAFRVNALLVDSVGLNNQELSRLLGGEKAAEDEIHQFRH